MGGSDFIAVDWGTTNRRVYLIDGRGAVVRSERDDRGVLKVARTDFPAEVAGIRQRFGDLDVLCAGMVGSTRGWVEVPYLGCPADLRALAGALHRIDTRTAIVPGVAVRDAGRGDVMRGEEVQLLGAVAAGLAPADGLLCQPGTHCKWAWLDGAGVRDFRTTMTGELFALLKQHSLLSDFLTGTVTPAAAFRAGVDAARAGRLLGDLFGARAGVLLGLRDRDDVPSYISGLLIGTDIREQDMPTGATVHLLADAELTALYAAALAVFHIRSQPVDSHAAFVAGINAIRELS